MKSIKDTYLLMVSIIVILNVVFIILFSDSAFEWVTKERKFGSEIYKVHNISIAILIAIILSYNYHQKMNMTLLKLMKYAPLYKLTYDLYMFQVKHDDIKQIYYVMSVKSVILKYIKKVQQCLPHRSGSLLL